MHVDRDLTRHQTNSAFAVLLASNLVNNLELLCRVEACLIQPVSLLSKVQNLQTSDLFVVLCAFLVNMHLYVLRDFSVAKVGKQLVQHFKCRYCMFHFHFILDLRVSHVSSFKITENDHRQT